MSRVAAVGYCPECAAYIARRDDHDPYCGRYVESGTDRSEGGGGE